MLLRKVILKENIGSSHLWKNYQMAMTYEWFVGHVECKVVKETMNCPMLGFVSKKNLKSVN